MCRFVVPWTVLPPVGRRDFFPGVVEGAGGFEHFHGEDDDDVRNAKRFLLFCF